MTAHSLNEMERIGCKQDRSLVAQLHETLRCVRLFDAVGCAKLFRSLQVDYRGRKPYLSYLIQCRQSLLSVLAHLERLANRVEQDKAVCHRFLIAVCVRLFLERRDQLLVDFVDEFQHLVAADEKADWLESFLQRLSQQLERDPVWQSASPYQVSSSSSSFFPFCKPHITFDLVSYHCFLLSGLDVEPSLTLCGLF